MKTVLLLLTLLIIGICAVLGAQKISLPAFGTNDFIEYWSAFQAAGSGLNPYDPASLLAIQKAQGWNADTPQMMWNPPWLLVLLWPVLGGAFLKSAYLWFALNVAAALLICVLLAEIYGLKRQLWAVLLLGLSFYPFYANFQLGQMGLIYGAAAVFLLWSMCRRFEAGGAACLTVLTVKPHLLYLFIVAILWSIARERSGKLVLWCAVFMGTLLCVTQVVFPGCILEWATAVRGAEHAVHITEWRAATLTQFAADHWAGDAGTALLIVTVVPGLAAAGLFYSLMRRGHPLNWAEFFPPIAALSLATAPYGWIFDQTVLLAISTDLLSRLIRSTSIRVKLLLSVLIGLFQFAPSIAARYIIYHHQFFWCSSLGLVVWLIGKQIDEAPKAASR